jgi:TPR repeat protein
MKKICILILLTIHLFGNTIEIAKDLFENKQQYKEAIEIFQKYKDDPESQYYIGKAYYYGMGVDKDSKKAFEYAKKSADKNNSSGLNLLGVIYQYGEGIEKDESQALVYYKQAANLGNKKAMTNLFHTYVDDISSITKDYKEALYWIEKAYDAGDIDAAYFIGIIYQELKNLEKAKKYLEVIISNSTFAHKT